MSGQSRASDTTPAIRIAARRSASVRVVAGLIALECIGEPVGVSAVRS
jgi:hypothetical protein